MHECIYNHTFNLLLKEVMRATSSALSDLIKDINNTVTIDEGELNISGTTNQLNFPCVVTTM